MRVKYQTLISLFIRKNTINELDKPPFANWPMFDNDEIDAVKTVLLSGNVNYWTGDEGNAFECAYAKFVGRKHAVALANGTLALELALIALDLQPGDEVIVPSRTFIATASAVVARGGVPIFADVDLDSQNVTADTIRAAITPRTKGVIVVHLAGWPCDMGPILTLTKEQGLFVVEDCAQAHGATYKGRPVGSFGDAAAFSFCQDKIISTGGEGGLLVMDSEELWKKAWAYKDHGKSYDAVFNQHHPLGFRWLHESFGSNWRMTEMQAAIGRIQLSKLPSWVASRRRNAKKLHDLMKNIPGLRLVMPPANIEHAYYRYYAFLETEQLAPEWSQMRILEAIGTQGIPCSVGSCGEIYREQAFICSELAPLDRLPIAKQLTQTSLAFLIHPTLGDAEITETAEVVREVMMKATASR